MIKAVLMVLSMLAVGVLVWRALQRQEARQDDTAEGEPPASGRSDGPS